MYSLDEHGEMHDEDYIQTHSNFGGRYMIPMPPAWFLESEKHRMTAYVQGKVNDFDHRGEEGSGWGHATLLQVEALREQETAARYVHTGTTATRGDSGHNEYAWPAVKESHEGSSPIFHKPGPLGMDDLESIKAEFEDTSQPLTLASFGIISYMNRGSDAIAPKHRFMANNGNPNLVSHMTDMANTSEMSPNVPMIN